MRLFCSAFLSFTIARSSDGIFCISEVSKPSTSSYFIRIKRLSTVFQTPKSEAEERKEEERAHRSYKTKQLFPPSSPSSWGELLLLLCTPNTGGCIWCIAGNFWHSYIPDFSLLFPKCRFSERLCCIKTCQEKKVCKTLCASILEKKRGL